MLSSVEGYKFKFVDDSPTSVMASQDEITSADKNYTVEIRDSTNNLIVVYHVDMHFSKDPVVYPPQYHYIYFGIYDYTADPSGDEKKGYSWDIILENYLH